MRRWRSHVSSMAACTDQERGRLSREHTQRKTQIWGWVGKEWGLFKHVKLEVSTGRPTAIG